MKVSLFKNFNRVEQNLEMGVILDQIRGGKYKTKVLALRELVRQGKLDEYNDQKRSLPGFTPSGLFEGGRKLKHLKEYSGVLVLDLDDLSQEQLISIRSRVEEINFTYACFISHGGQGLKILVRVFSRPVLHKQAFNQVKDFYERELNVLIDPSGKDVTRLCFVSWDEQLYLNPSSSIFKPFVNLLEEDIEYVVRRIEEKKVDITVDFDTWIRIGFALTDALGEEGRSYFHRVSRFYPNYNEADCNLQFYRCLHAGNTGVTSASFFHFARDQGIDISTCRSQQSTVIARSPALRDNEANSVIARSEATKQTAVIANPAAGGMKQTPNDDQPANKPETRTAAINGGSSQQKKMIFYVFGLAA